MSFRKDKQTVFLFYVTNLDSRFSVTLGSILSVLPQIDPDGFAVSVNIILFNGVVGGLEEHLGFLSSLYPHVRFRAFSHQIEDVLEQTGFNRSFTHIHLNNCGYRGKFIIVMRLFIPLIYDANWFVYLDDDVLAGHHFFPEILLYASDATQILFACFDEYLVGSRFLMRVLNRARRRELSSTYFGSGFLVMRGGTVLREQMRNAIRYLSKYSPLRFPDQDALNFAVNRSMIGFFPSHFVTVGFRHRTQKTDFAVLRHYANRGRHPNSQLKKCFGNRYFWALNEWKRNAINSTAFATLYLPTRACP
jgi:lipopolysaccharide biosynthesis glycosyltransferase